MVLNGREVGWCELCSAKMDGCGLFLSKALLLQPPIVVTQSFHNRTNQANPA